MNKNDSLRSSGSGPSSPSAPSSRSESEGLSGLLSVLMLAEREAEGPTMPVNRRLLRQLMAAAQQSEELRMSFEESERARTGTYQELKEVSEDLRDLMGQRVVELQSRLQASESNARMFATLADRHREHTKKQDAALKAAISCLDELAAWNDSEDVLEPSAREARKAMQKVGEILGLESSLLAMNGRDSK